MELQRNVCIVTGSNSGIGREVAAALLARGAHVIMACRNTEGSAECSKLDLEDEESIHQFAQRCKEAHLTRRRLHVLVNNAGVMGVADYPDGRDRHLWVNHLGPFLLTRLLAPNMGDGSRIVNVSSRASFAGSLTVRDAAIASDPSWWWPQYARSKLCNLLFTAELQRRLAPHGVTAHAVSPGLVNTPLFTHLPWYAAAGMRVLGPWVGKTPQEGAETAVYAATAPELAGSSELFFHNCKPMRASAQARDPQLARDLWEASERLVGPRRNCGQSYV